MQKAQLRSMDLVFLPVLLLIHETDAEVIVLEDYKNLLCELCKKDRGYRLVSIYSGFLVLFGFVR